MGALKNADLRMRCHGGGPNMARWFPSLLAFMNVYVGPITIPIGSMALSYLPCYLPKFLGDVVGQMLVNIPYMEHTG